jgi:hypothetical protein
VAQQKLGFMLIDPLTVENLKLALASEMPVVVGVNVDGNFDRHVGAEVLAEYDREEVRRLHDEGQGTGHAICVVGYDDAKRAFRVINSWGTLWGDMGYAWVDYDQFEPPGEDVDRSLWFCMIGMVVFDAPTIRTAVSVQAAAGAAAAPEYRWSVEVDGAGEAIRRIESVTYSLGDRFQPPRVVREKAGAFGLRSGELRPASVGEPFSFEVEFRTRTGEVFGREIAVAAGGGGPSGDGEVVRLPDLGGLDPTDAALRLMRLGVRPRIQRLDASERPAGARPGRVARVAPAAAGSVRRGATVTIYVYGR